MVNNYKFLAVILGLLIIFPVFFAAATSNSCRTGRDGYCVELAAVVPGLEFLKYDDSKGLGGFIASIYVFGLGLVGFSALIMLIYASFLYMTAGDNMNRVGEAKKKISGALFGLVLAFLSWIILRTINPDLVQSLDIKLTPITLEATPKSPINVDISKNLGDKTCVKGDDKCPVGFECQSIYSGRGTCVPVEFLQNCTPAGGGKPDSCTTGYKCQVSQSGRGQCRPEALFIGCNPAITAANQCPENYKCTPGYGGRGTCTPDCGRYKTRTECIGRSLCGWSYNICTPIL